MIWDRLWLRAAADTIKRHFKDLNRTADDYDLILTGDLSGVGSPIVKDILKEDGYPVGTKHDDCGLLIYTPDQQVFAGGAAVLVQRLSPTLIFLSG